MTGIFSDESEGINSRTKIFINPGAGRLSPGAWTAFFRGLDGFHPVPGQAASVARAAFLQLQDRLPPGPGRPSSSSRTGYLLGRDGLPVNRYHNSITQSDIWIYGIEESTAC
jgi:hypothetical protein